MIQANELRIGNYIKDRGGKMWQIDHWERHDKVSAKEPIIGECQFTKKPLFGHSLNEYVEYLQPIPLTEELLLRLGFEEYMSKNDIRISIGGGVLLQFHFGVNQIECWIGDEISRTDVYYLHELQNLYYSLTKNELTLKP